MENIIAYLLVAHFVGDFLCQSDEMATQKLKSYKWLTIHVLVYTAVIAAFVTLAFGWKAAIFFSLLNGAVHWGVDYFTSRINAKLWAQQKVHYFFVGVGVDQLIHAVTLIYTAALLPKH